MARTPNARIVEWGTPPDPEPSGWDAIAAELIRKPGEWASLGAMSTTTARKVGIERLPSPQFETRSVAGKDAGKVVVWVRAAEESGQVETRDAEPVASDSVVDLDAKPTPRATVKRGAVV